MFMGQAYTDVLTPHEQQALQASCDILIDSIFDFPSAICINIHQLSCGSSRFA